MKHKQILCLVCDFEGKVIYHDPIFDITKCPSCGEELEYQGDDDYDDDSMDI
jgi:hypothetical protein